MSSLSLSPRILVELSCAQSDVVPRVSIAGHPYWAGSAPSLQGPVGEDGLRTAFSVHGEAILHHLDGAFTVVVQSGRDTFAVTDRFNIVPLYVGKPGNRFVLSTDTDALARHLQSEDDLDLVSMAQALQMWNATHPFTFYRDIRELSPASVHHWNARGEYTRKPYGEPQYRGHNSVSHAELADELAAAIKDGVQRRVAESEHCGLLLSAGADSRAVLFSAAAVQPVTCYTFYDAQNAELEGARRLAEAAGQAHSALQRDPEHYGLSAIDSVRLSGGMWNLLDAHATGFAQTLRNDGLDLLLSGDFADLLFKGDGLNLRYRRFAGKALPLKTVGSFTPIWRKPRGRVGAQWKDQIESRLLTQFSGITTDNPDEAAWWRIAHRRVGTLSNVHSFSGRAVMQRVLPWDTFMADAAIVAVYEKMTTAARVNGGVWERAVKILTPPDARRIVNNNVLAPVGASGFEKLARFLYGVAYRKIMKREIDGTPLDGSVTRGSWPNWSTYFSQSPVIEKLWSGISAESREIIGSLRGEDPWQRSHTEIAKKDSLGFGRLLTQALWLDERKRDA